MSEPIICLCPNRLVPGAVPTWETDPQPECPKHGAALSGESKEQP